MADFIISGGEVKIELLYFDGCPSWKNGLKNLQAALSAENVEADIHMVRVESDDDAAREKFLGSPSFRINGKDMWPEERLAYYLGCRVYATEDGMQGYPTIKMLRDKIHEVQEDN